MPRFLWPREGLGPWRPTHSDRWEGLTIGLASVLAILQLTHCVRPALGEVTLHALARPAAATLCAVGAEPLCPRLGARDPESQRHSSWGPPSFPTTPADLTLLILSLILSPTRYSCLPQDINTCCFLTPECSSVPFYIILMRPAHRVQFKGHSFLGKTSQSTPPPTRSASQFWVPFFPRTY